MSQTNPIYDDDYNPFGCGNSSDTEVPRMDSERVMKEIQRIYHFKDIGLRDAAKSMSDRNFRVTMPRNKLTVLIVGNHNAAKQKFLDLYFSDSRQAAGSGFVSKVDYEKLDKIYITHGDRRRFLVGETVLDYCPHLEKLKNVPGLKDYLTTEIASRHTKSLVSFILAPESITVPSTIMPISDTIEPTTYDDNNNSTTTTIQRSCDMRQALGTLADAADLIFVFFDPTGGTPPSETLEPFENIWETHHEKILLLLARASEGECSEETRENVLTQIVREIWRNPVVRRVGYLPEIYCPDLASGIRDDERLWSVIQNSADQSVDKALFQLEQDAIKVRDKLEAMKKRNETAKQNRDSPPSLFFWLIVLLLILFVILSTQYKELICMGKEMQGICDQMMENKALASAAGIIMIFYLVYNLFLEGKQPMLTEGKEKMLNMRIHFVNQALSQKEKMERLYVGMNLNN